MPLYQNLIFPLLKRLDAERAHDWTTHLLSMAQATPPGRAILRKIAGALPDRPVRLWGLDFPNVLGIAAGFDKNVRVAPGLALLGFGHVEVGTLTPRPQPGNPRPRIFRLPAHGAVINRMGFPNGGVEAALPRLRALADRRFILGVSLGKQKETPIEAAAGDYLAVMRAVYPHADYLAVNISSPNTPGLRQLQGKAELETLLRELKTEQAALAQKHAIPPRPLLVKIAPDLEEAPLIDLLDVLTATGIEGIIATNTTLSRPGLAADPLAAETGGLSGRPLADPSTRVIATIARETGGRLPIIGVGGIFTDDDAQKKLDAGASLLQIYTGLIYEGPALAGNILRSL